MVSEGPMMLDLICAAELPSACKYSSSKEITDTLFNIALFNDFLNLRPYINKFSSCFCCDIDFGEHFIFSFFQAESLKFQLPDSLNSIDVKDVLRIIAPPFGIANRYFLQKHKSRHYYFLGSF
jgi:hypothetical protein